MGYQWGRKRRGKGRGRGREPKKVFIHTIFPISRMVPIPAPSPPPEPIILNPAELEALRLVDLEGKSQEEAGECMGISRTSVWRYLQEGRKKLIIALTEGRELHLQAPATLNQSYNQKRTLKDQK
ncbi:MAG: DUF134 domain-containing protein [Candidatus Hermodarchaeota archaeon]